jgi:multidrug resistance efflux pump
MSAILNPLPQPPAQPPALKPVPATPGSAEPKRSRGPQIIGLIVLVAAVAIGVKLLLDRQASQQAEAVPVAKIVKVMRGPLEVQMRISGQTSARTFANVTVPRMTGPEGSRPLMLLSLAQGGRTVRAGEEVASIDAQSLLDHIDDVHSTVVQAQSDVIKRRAEQAIESENLQQSIRVARASFDKARLDAQAAEVRTPIDQELFKLSVDEAKAALDELSTDIKTKAISQRAEVRVLEFTTERHVRHRDRHKKDAARFKIPAPMNGMVVLQNVFSGSEFRAIQDGDQVYSGQSVLKIVSPNSMQVEATVNQSDSDRFRVGQKAMIGFDAFPGLRLPGKVYSIGAIAVAGYRANNYIRNVPVRVQIDGVDPRVIPDLSASADVLLEQRPNQLLVPRAALHSQAGKQFVWVKQGSKFARRDVQIVDRNATSAAVTGVQEGEEVAINYVPPVETASR